MNTTDVLIVGAGPTGLVLGNELLRRGVPCRVIDKQNTYPTSTRGHALQPRTLEVLDTMGILDQMLAVGSTRFTTRFYSGGEPALELDMSIGARPDAPYPNAPLSRQPRFEGVLRDHFVALGGTVEHSSELVDLSQDETSVSATVRHTATGQTQEMRAQYLVGCDGGHSAVRKLLGLSFDGEATAEHFVLADAEVDWDLDPSADLAYWFVHRDGALLASTYGAGPAWGLFAQVAAGPSGEAEPASAGLFSRIIAERAGRHGVQLHNVTWLSNYTISRRLVDHYRRGRAFVAGDAAHIHSPSGGQGMNTGIQDAFNLAWKLALVARGKASDSLLDTYEEERRPVAQALLGSTRSGDAALFSHSPAMTFLRERVAAPLLNHPSVREMLLYRLAQLDITYRGSSLAEGSATGAHSLAEWLEGRSAPRPGDRAPQAHGTDPSIFAELRTGTWTLLLFDGYGSDHVELLEIGRRAEALAAGELRPLLVHAGSQPPEGLDRRIPVLLDPAHQVHRTYGVGVPTVVLVRPDGYLGFRGAPPAWEPLERYLKRVFLVSVGELVGGRP